MHNFPYVTLTIYLAYGENSIIKIIAYGNMAHLKIKVNCGLVCYCLNMVMENKLRILSLDNHIHTVDTIKEMIFVG